MSRKWRRREYFRGNVYFGSDGCVVDVGFYGDTTNSVAVWDGSASEMYFDGADLWLKDDDQLEFGDASDFVIDWANATTDLRIIPAAANGEIMFGTSTYMVNIDGDLGVVDVDLYGTNAAVNINRNQTSGTTNAPVVVIKQDNAGDDQVTLQLQQDAAYAALDLDGALDADCPSTYTSGAFFNINRNLTSGNTDAAVVLVKQDHTSDDMSVLRLDQDATSYLALEANGWCDIGYEAAASPTGTPPAGSVKFIKAGSKFFICIAADGAGTMKYLEISSSSTA